MSSLRRNKVVLSAESRKKITAEYERTLKTLAEKFQAEQQVEKERIKKAAKDGTGEDGFESVVSGGLEELRGMMENQDIDDFFEAAAEYRAAAYLAGVEAYSYQYNKENIDDLLDDIIDTTAILNEKNINMACYNYMTEVFDKVMKEAGYKLWARSITGRKKDMTASLYDYRHDIAISIFNGGGLVTTELVIMDKEERKATKEERALLRSYMSAFDGEYEQLCHRLAEEGILFEKEIFQMPEDEEYIHVVSLAGYEKVFRGSQMQ